MGDAFFRLAFQVRGMEFEFAGTDTPIVVDKMRMKERRGGKKTLMNR